MNAERQCTQCHEPLERSGIEIRDIARDYFTARWSGNVLKRFCDQVCAQRWYLRADPGGLGPTFETTGDLIEDDEIEVEEVA